MNRKQHQFTIGEFIENILRATDLYFKHIIFCIGSWLILNNNLS